MSYDISIAGREFNYTSNLSLFFHTYIPTGRGGAETTGLLGLHEMTGEEALDALLPALVDITTDLRDRGVDWMNDEYNPGNGWGGWSGALHLLTEITRECHLHPRCVLRIYS